MHASLQAVGLFLSILPVDVQKGNAATATCFLVRLRLLTCAVLMSL